MPHHPPCLAGPTRLCGNSLSQQETCPCTGVTHSYFNIHRFPTAVYSYQRTYSYGSHLHGEVWVRSCLQLAAADTDTLLYVLGSSFVCEKVVGGRRRTAVSGASVVRYHASFIRVLYAKQNSPLPALAIKLFRE